MSSPSPLPPQGSTSLGFPRPRCTGRTQYNRPPGAGALDLLGVTRRQLHSVLFILLVSYLRLPSTSLEI